MANSDRNDLSYSTSDPSGGSGETAPTARQTTAIAMPAVALPVVGYPSTTQALRRPPMAEGRRTQSAGNHRRHYSGSRGRESRERYTRPTRTNPVREDRDASPPRPTPSERARQRRDEREVRQARRDRADRELRARSIASSEPDSERSTRSRSPTPSVDAISLARISARPTPVGPTPLASEGSGSNAAPRTGGGVSLGPQSSNWQGVIIDTPRAPSLAGPLPPSPRFEPDPRVSVATRTALWERAGFDADAPGPAVAVGPGYVGDVDSQPLGTSQSQRTDSNDTRPPYYSAPDAVLLSKR
jgi:hypothetical protein